MFTKAQDEKFQQAVINALENQVFMSERELGQAVGVSRPQVSRWKAGRSLPGPSSRKTVCRVLNG